jgi:TRAP-type C4-dicarboxylate transport system permease large subunit
MLLTEYFLDLSSNPVTIMILLNLFFVVVGCFMSTVVSITILTPLLVPLIKQVGIDPIHFGVVMCLNLTLGNITPPFGMVLYVLCKISKLSFPDVVNGQLKIPIFGHENSPRKE